MEKDTLKKQIEQDRINTLKKGKKRETEISNLIKIIVPEILKNLEENKIDRSKITDIIKNLKMTNQKNSYFIELLNIEIEKSLIQQGIEIIFSGDINLDVIKNMGDLRNVTQVDSIKQYFLDIMKKRLLTPAEEIALGKRILMGDEEAINQMVEGNLRFVVSVAKRFAGRSIPFLDLIEEGNLGLITAAKKFDYRKGYRFSTYAYWWIKQAIIKGIHDKSRIIRISYGRNEEIYKINRIEEQLEQKYGRIPSPEEIALAVGTTPSRIEKMKKYARQEPISYETPIGEDSTLKEVIVNDTDEQEKEKIESHGIKKACNNILDSLSKREAIILRLRFGFYDGKTRSLKVVGQILGIKGERVRQIEERALQKIRTSSNIKTIVDYIDSPFNSYDSTIINNASKCLEICQNAVETMHNNIDIVKDIDTDLLMLKFTPVDNQFLSFSEIGEQLNKGAERTKVDFYQECEEVVKRGLISGLVLAIAITEINKYNKNKRNAAQQRKQYAKQNKLLTNNK